MDKIRVHLLFVGILWLQFNGNIATICGTYGQKIDECWSKHSDVSSCKFNDPLVVCIDNYVAQMPSDCPMKNKVRAQQMLGLGQSLQRTVCARRSDILEEFISKPDCWQMARLCLVHLPISFEEIVYRYDPPLFDLDKVDSVPNDLRKQTVAAECYEEGDAIEKCSTRVKGCDYFEDFIDAILTASICDSYRIKDCPTCAFNSSNSNRINKPEEVRVESKASVNKTDGGISLILILCILNKFIVLF